MIKCRTKPERLFHIRLRHGDLRGAQILIQENDQTLARLLVWRYAHKAVNQIIDNLCGVLELGVQHHAGQIDLRKVAQNGLDSLDGHLRAPETAIARVEILIAVGVLVRLRDVHFALVLGGGADVHSLADALGDSANLAAAGIAVGRKEADIGKQNVAREIAPLQKQARSNPTLAAGPSRYGRLREELLPQRARGQVEVRNAGNTLQSEFAVGGHGQLHRALEMRAHRSRAVEVARQENLFEKRRELIMVVAQHGAQLFLELR